MPGGKLLWRLLEPLMKRGIAPYELAGSARQGWLRRIEAASQYGRRPSKTDRVITIVGLTCICG